MTKRLLRQAIANLPGGLRAPRVLLTSVPEEPHVIGLLMAESLFTLEGAECIPLGTQMPLLEIGRAANAHRADIVALSFSSAFPQRQIPGLLQQLRMVLPTETSLWAGGGDARWRGFCYSIHSTKHSPRSQHGVTSTHWLLSTTKILAYPIDHDHHDLRCPQFRTKNLPT